MGKYALHRMQMRMMSRIAKSILSGGNMHRADLIEERGSSRSTKWRYSKSLEELIREGFVVISGEKIALSEKGLEIAKKSQVFDLTLERDEKWDGIWHVVTYDIPESLKKERNIFQSKLKSIGFYQLQRSLWVFPFSCEEEIGLLVNELALANYVAFLKTESVPFNKKVREYFNL